MRIPERFKVGSSTWKVKYKKELDGPHERTLGATHPYIKEVHLLDGIEEQAMQETFMHELLHVCSSFVEIDPSQKMVEEEFVTRIATVLHTVLMENDFFNGKK